MQVDRAFLKVHGKILVKLAGIGEVMIFLNMDDLRQKRPKEGPISIKDIIGQYLNNLTRTLRNLWSLRP